MEYFVERYEEPIAGGGLAPDIKWSRNLKRRFEQGRREGFSADQIVRAAYRPFYSPVLYDSELFIDEGGAKQQMFPLGKANRAICFSDAGSRTAYVVLAVDGLADLHFGSSIDAYQQVPLIRFDSDGNPTENITDWALKQFRDHYKARGAAGDEPSSSSSQRRLGSSSSASVIEQELDSGLRRNDEQKNDEQKNDEQENDEQEKSQQKTGKPTPITKEAIFHYVYAVLHDPLYREKYAQNLKREFPRIPCMETNMRISGAGPNGAVS